MSGSSAKAGSGDDQAWTRERGAAVSMLELRGVSKIYGTGAGEVPRTRRTLTAVTAGALALLGALLGTAAGYVASIAWFRGSALNGGVGALANAPIGDLLFIVVGMPLIAVAIGWLLAGREPPAIAHQPIE